MPPSLSPQEARRLLGVPASAGPVTLKRAYRRLAREHHPDRGGDPDTFHRLRLAYERLATETGQQPPVAARGRPSRPSAAADTSADVDLGAVDWDGQPPPRGARLDRERLARWLADESEQPVRPLLAASRSPGSRLNRFSASLAAELTAHLRVEPIRDDRGVVVVRMEVAASNRRARRALDRCDLDAAWVRTRRPSSTLVHGVLDPAPDRRVTALRVTERLGGLLDALAWPLPSWVVTETT